MCQICMSAKPPGSEPYQFNTDQIIQIHIALRLRKGNNSMKNGKGGGLRDATKTGALTHQVTTQEAAGWQERDGFRMKFWHQQVLCNIQRICISRYSTLLP